MSLLREAPQKVKEEKSVFDLPDRPSGRGKMRKSGSGGAAAAGSDAGGPKRCRVGAAEDPFDLPLRPAAEPQPKGGWKRPRRTEVDPFDTFAP